MKFTICSLLLSHIKPIAKTSCKFSGQARVLVVGVGGLGLWATGFVKVIYGDKALVCVADLFVSICFVI